MSNKQVANAQRSLHPYEKKCSSFINHNEHCYYEVDLKGRFTFATDALSASLGYSKEAFLCLDYGQYMLPDTARRVFRVFNHVFSTYQPAKDVYLQVKHTDDSILECDISVYCIFDYRGRVIGFRGSASNIRPCRRIDDLRQSEMKFRMMFEKAPLGIIHFDKYGRVTACNHSFLKMSQPFGQNAFAELGSLTRLNPNLGEAVEKALRGHQAVYQGEYQPNTSGNGIHVEAQAAPITAEDGSSMGALLIISDITERRRYEQTIRHMAYHDFLTGLPNRLLINDRMSVALPQAKRAQTLLAIVYLDLDNFKLINDTLGHIMGDRLLQEVSIRLQSLVRAGDTIARMGGDEFMFLFPSLSQPRDAFQIADKILNSFSSPFNVDQKDILVTASFGISLFPVHGQDSDTLIRNADDALYRAKQQGRNNFQMYAPAVAPLFLERSVTGKDWQYSDKDRIGLPSWRKTNVLDEWEHSGF
ncbi:MAG: sensor domain-containing diguanylate cyclase [Syntrophomonadaceae bacterium]|nr:sensor domain-containing diguanylate cyclase [Syntrophomonadaceae bacterium]